MFSKLERKLFSSDNQEVGLEAAILERKRKSSLAEESSAEDLTRIKETTEDRGPTLCRAVGERSNGGEGHDESWTGAIGSENAGMSSESPVRIRTAECLRFPTQRSSTWG